MTILSRVFSRVPGLVALIALLAVVMILPASAQDNHVQRYGEKDTEKSATEKAAEKEAQKAYERSLGNIPAQKSTDPWGIVRSDDAPKAAKAAPAKPKVKNEAAKTDATKSADSKTGAAAK
ncbi:MULTISPECIES: hypothetical protein [Bradyrhizobium]|jgi:hypothetical protein|uniref:DUF4148 domain-containing protein n=2 Tax=Bradyrhizobium TaxID=374 RepID=A0ABY0QFD9_9BRAD|nr:MULTISPECIES: hypothetical protein [Bradyrhizobium]SDK15417.1 hypothetical protein SAMN05444163_7375 [Bradyrhizobium ottawaense]SEE50167.1 hypothetical protein SAMN05444171_7756 [Bradyrhizobium lablabi]SHM51180.1 hypothetical protein SAMN05444321_6584 [Bradyrhizobium lablabi]